MLNLPYIRSRRESLDLSLADAARLAGWGEKARGHWYDIESGRAHNPTLKTMLDMCRVLECDISQLVNTSPHPHGKDLSPSDRRDDRSRRWLVADFVICPVR